VTHKSILGSVSVNWRQISLQAFR